MVVVVVVVFSFIEMRLAYACIHTLSFLHAHTRAHTHTHTHSFVSLMPTPTLFIVFSFLLRIVEGIGTAMYSTASFTLLTQLYSERKGAIVVSDHDVIEIGPEFLEQKVNVLCVVQPTMHSTLSV